MAREIKFRAWHPTSGMAMTPILQRSDYTGAVSCMGYDKEGNAISLPLMQFTGLKDQNGIEIYEGDALRLLHDDGESNYLGVVTWISEGDWLGWCCMDKNMPEELKADWQDSLLVIGNIYENPELAA